MVKLEREISNICVQQFYKILKCHLNAYVR